MTAPAPAITWRDIKVDGRDASFCDAGNARLYVCTRHGAVEAWVDQVKIGNYADFDAAKKAACIKAGLIKGPAPIKMQATSRAYVTTSPPPIADMSKPPVITPTVKQIEGISTPTVDEMAEYKGLHPRCKCGATLDRKGVCPALCEPLPAPPPIYVGPKVVGRTHIGRMAQPADGWIGR